MIHDVPGTRGCGCTGAALLVLTRRGFLTPHTSHGDAADEHDRIWGRRGVVFSVVPGIPFTAVEYNRYPCCCCRLYHRYQASCNSYRSSCWAWPIAAILYVKDIVATTNCNTVGEVSAKKKIFAVAGTELYYFYEYQSLVVLVQSWSTGSARKGEILLHTAG